MNTNDLIQVLDATSNGLQSLQTVLPPATLDQIVSFLANLDSGTLDIVLPLVQLSNPNMTKDQLVKVIESGKQVANAIKTMETNGTFDKISNLCNKVKNRPLILRMIAAIL